MEKTRQTPFAAPAAAGFWLIAFILSCRLAGEATPPSSPGARSFAGMVWGQSRLALSGHFFELADEYFHRGLGHLRRQAFEDDLFQRLKKHLSPTAHEHLEGRAVREMMPWLRLAIQAAPSNADLYLVAAFWLARDMKEPRLAEAVLREAQVACPFDYRVALEKGRLYLREHRTDEALAAFHAALAFWPRPLPSDHPDARFDRATLLLYRALLFEHFGRRDEAASDLRAILSLYPDRHAIRDRLQELESGSIPSVLPLGLARDMLRREDAERGLCSREHDHGDPHGHAHEAHGPPSAGDDR